MKTQKQAPKPSRRKRSTKDIYAMRKRKKRRKVLKQSIWLLLLAITILVLYQRRDSWLPKLETIGLRHQSQHQEPQDGSNGNFPLYIFGDSDFQMAHSAGNLLVLSDSYLYVYETDGSLMSSRQHTYGNAMMQTAGNYILLYESGGTHFRLETAAKMRFEKTLTDPIVFGRVSENGLTAIVTGADTCACKLLVFNAKGQQIYERSCVERIADICFHPDENGCYAASIRAENGGLVSVLHSYSFTEAEDIWSSQPLDMLAISVYNTNEDALFVLGDTMSCFMTAQGNVLSSYVYPDTLTSGCFAGNTAALLLTNSETRTESLAILNGSADNPVLRTYDKAIREISILPEYDAVLVQLRKQIETISYSGALLRSTAVSGSYDGFLRIGQTIFLRGYDTIDVQEYS